jgi:hypothetical protein
MQVEGRMKVLAGDVAFSASRTAKEKVTAALATLLESLQVTRGGATVSPDAFNSLVVEIKTALCKTDMVLDVAAAWRTFKEQAGKAINSRNAKAGFRQLEFRNVSAYALRFCILAASLENNLERIAKFPANSRAQQVPLIL